MEAYSVGVKLALASNAEEVLGVMATKLFGVHMKVNDLKEDFGKLKLAVGGAFAIGGAMALVGVMDKLIAKGAEYENTLYRIQTAGFTPKEMSAIKVNATKVANQFPNLTEGELIRLQGELTPVYGSAGVAMKNLPTAAAYMAAIKYRHPEDAEGAASIAEDSIFKILRSEEMRGLAQNPAEVKVALAASLKGQEVFGDQFDPSIAFQAVKYGRLSSRYLSDRFLLGPGLIMAQELGGSNMGNSLNQVMQAYVGGHMTKTALEKNEEIGIIDRKKVKLGPHGMFDLRDAVPDLKLLQSDPDLWMQGKHFAGKIDKYTRGDTAMRDQIIRQLVFRTTGQQMIEMLGWQTGPGGRISKDVGMLNRAITPEQAVATSMGNLQTSTQNLKVQFDRLGTNLGIPVAHAVGGISKRLVNPIKNLATAAGGHPGAAGGVDAGILGLIGGGFAFGGNTIYKLAKWGLGKLPAETFPKLAGMTGKTGILADLGGLASKLPLIGRIGTMIGGVVAAIVDLPVVTLVGITAGVIGLGAGVYEAAKHWDASKGAIQNFKQEWGELADFIVGTSKRLQGMVPGAPPQAGQLHATIPVSIGGKHVETLAVRAVTKALNGHNAGGRNTDPRATPAQSGAALAGGHG